MRPLVNACSLALACVVVLGACSDNGGGEAGSLSGSEPWTSADAIWMQPARTPMGFDLVVPQGAELIGPVFSTFDTRSPVDGGDPYMSEQQARLYSNADIVEVSDGLLTQLGAANMEGTQTSDSICVQEINRGETLGTTTKPYVGTADADAVELVCSGYWPNAVSDSGDGIEFDLRQDLRKPDQPVLGLVRWWESRVAAPGSLPEAPDTVGGPRTITTNVEGDPDLEIVDGSFLAGPQGWGSITGGFSAVIGVSGDPDEVFDEYMAYQVTDPEVATEATIGPLRIRQGTTGGAGGVTYTVTLNEIDGNSWILLEAYND